MLMFGHVFGTTLDVTVSLNTGFEGRLNVFTVFRFSSSSSSFYVALSMWCLLNARNLREYFDVTYIHYHMLHNEMLLPIK